MIIVFCNLAGSQTFLRVNGGFGGFFFTSRCQQRANINHDCVSLALAEMYLLCSHHDRWHLKTAIFDMKDKNTIPKKFNRIYIYQGLLLRMLYTANIYRFGNPYKLKREINLSLIILITDHFLKESSNMAIRTQPWLQFYNLQMFLVIHALYI